MQFTASCVEKRFPLDMKTPSFCISLKSFSSIINLSCFEVERVHRVARTARFVRVVYLWADFEFFRGLLVYLPLVVTSLGTSLISDPSSGLWVFMLTEWVAKYASYVFWDLTDTIRLWYISKSVRKFLREIYLSFVPGSVINYAELL